jgi:hypothetical protein
MEASGGLFMGKQSGREMHDKERASLSIFNRLLRFDRARRSQRQASGDTVIPR